MLTESELFPQLIAADGRRYVLTPGHVLIGRSADADIQLGDGTVSGHHARVDTADSRVTLTDLHSTNGTWVGDARLESGSTVPLHHGDRVQVGSTQLRFVAATSTRTAEGPVFEAGQQSAGQINNVGGNQYLQTLVQQRESFLRDVAASRSRARKLIWFGFLLFALGGGAFAWMVIRFISRVSALDPEEQPSYNELWGEKVGEIPVGLIGWAVGAAGAMLMVIGVVLHVIATSRQRRTLNQPIVPPELLLAHPWTPTR